MRLVPPALIPLTPSSRPLIARFVSPTFCSRKGTRNKYYCSRVTTNLFLSECNASMHEQACFLSVCFFSPRFYNPTLFLAVYNVT